MAYRALMSGCRLLLVFALSTALASLAATTAIADVATPPEPLGSEGPVVPAAAHPAANDDGITPGLTRAAATGKGIATSTLGYNSASKATTLDFNAEIQVWGPFRLVLRVDNVTEKARPGIGAAAQFLDEHKHGVAGSAYFSYKAEGFTEGEGELEGLVAFGKQLGPLHGTLNVAYGQDPEGNERDGEVALGLHVEALPNLFTGVVGRYRDALGSNGDKGTGILRDALGAASATYVLGRFGVTATAGVAGVELLSVGSMKAGVAGALAVGAAF
jgi:hypothetical protein